MCFFNKFCKKYFLMVSLPLLPNTKLPENIREQIVAGNFSRDLAEIMQGFLDILGEQIAGKIIVQPVDRALDGGAGMTQSIDVTRIGDNGFCHIHCAAVEQAHQLQLQVVDV